MKSDSTKDQQSMTNFEKSFNTPEKLAQTITEITSRCSKLDCASCFLPTGLCICDGKEKLIEYFNAKCCEGHSVNDNKQQ